MRTVKDIYDGVFDRSNGNLDLNSIGIKQLYSNDENMNIYLDELLVDLDENKKELFKSVFKSTRIYILENFALFSTYADMKSYPSDWVNFMPVYIYKYFLTSPLMACCPCVYKESGGPFKLLSFEAVENNVNENSSTEQTPSTLCMNLKHTTVEIDAVLRHCFEILFSKVAYNSDTSTLRYVDRFFNACSDINSMGPIQSAINSLLKAAISKNNIDTVYEISDNDVFINNIKNELRNMSDKIFVGSKISTGNILFISTNDIKFFVYDKNVSLDRFGGGCYIFKSCGYKVVATPFISPGIMCMTYGSDSDALRSNIIESFIVPSIIDVDVYGSEQVNEISRRTFNIINDSFVRILILK